jgi:hypothetical protein
MDSGSRGGCVDKNFPDMLPDGCQISGVRRSIETQAAIGSGAIQSSVLGPVVASFSHHFNVVPIAKFT